MTEWRLAGTENPRTGEVHHWIQRDRESVDIEDVIDALNEQQQEIERLRSELETERGHRQADNAESRQEIERLRAELNRVAVAVIAWDVSGRHRHCSCPSCEIICEIADNLKAAARAAEGGGDAK